jgi:peptidoglycan/xylan/chitin deacetylase (PgdA/CDA1 family)
VNNKIFALIFISFLGCNKMPRLVWDSPKHKIEEEVKVINLRNDINGIELTFDDGPSLAYTPKVLNILKKHNLHATFFVEGINLIGKSEAAKERRELLKRMVDEGHTIGNHSFDHHLFTSLPQHKVEWEIDFTTKLIEDITQQKVLLIRLPYGRGNKVVNKIIEDRGLTKVEWSVDPREWSVNLKTHQPRTKSEVIDDIMNQVNELRQSRGIKNIIIILHDTKSITVELLPTLLDKLENVTNIN